MKSLETLRKEMHSANIKHYYVVECPFCHSKLAIEYSEFEIVLFEPQEQEFETYRFEHHDDGSVKMIPTKEKRMVSSDYTKDLYKIELCCDCEHGPIVLTYAEFKALQMVDGDGTNNIHLHFDEVETAEARAFMQEHKDCCEKHLGKKWFSTTGGQFEYTICPTGLGNLINIKCNACKESKDITNTDNW